MPTIVFAELKIRPLAPDPDSTALDNRPYLPIAHLPDCPRELRSQPEELTKTVIRYHRQKVLFRPVHVGFYMTPKSEKSRYFALPDLNALESKYSLWSRSALSPFGA